MWRDLARRQSGEDVAALQQMLAGLGHFSGEANGTFGRDTQRAVIAWQKAEGRSQTGTVARGNSLRCRAFRSRSRWVRTSHWEGACRGEDAVLAPTGAREFVLVLTDDQARLVPAEATIEVTFEDKVWPAVIAGSTPDQGGTVSFELVAPDGARCAVAIAARCRSIRR
nr:peptidoglycan-binding domain-containing protein [Tessaracoccus coleopterorum]